MAINLTGSKFKFACDVKEGDELVIKGQVDYVVVNHIIYLDGLITLNGKFTFKSDDTIRGWFI